MNRDFSIVETVSKNVFAVKLNYSVSEKKMWPNRTQNDGEKFNQPEKQAVPSEIEDFEGRLIQYANIVEQPGFLNKVTRDQLVHIQKIALTFFRSPIWAQIPRGSSLQMRMHRVLTHINNEIGVRHAEYAAIMIHGPSVVRTQKKQ